MRSFASDNNSGAHPAILEAVAAANAGAVRSYGDDPLTAAAEAAFRRHFGPDARPYFVTTGTAANVLGLSALCRSRHGVVCAETAHINVDECGAPEAVAGIKLLTAPGRDGKIAPRDVEARLGSMDFVHHNRPRAVSVTQCTELGTLYAPEEIRELADYVHGRGLFLHMDGARLCNAAAALGLGLDDLTVRAGVDVLSFGGTKNGCLLAEAVVFLRPGLDEEFGWVRKQGMQLVSKMRFLSAQFERLLRDDLWRENALRANAMARRLSERIAGLPGLALARPVETNAVFARLPEAAIAALRRDWHFYVWNPAAGECRWMASFDTSEAEVDAFAKAVRKALAGS